MLIIFRQIVQILDRHEKRRGLALLFLIAIRGSVEMIGVGSILPFIAVAANPSLIESNQYLLMAYQLLNMEGHQQFLLILGITSFIVLLFSLCISALTQWATYRYTQMCNYRLSTRLLSVYLHRPYIWFLDHHSADLGRTVLAEVDHVVSSSILPALNLVSQLILIILLIGLVVVINPIVAVTAMTVLGSLYVITYFIVRGTLSSMGRDMYESNESRFKIGQEALGGIKDVKISGLEQNYVNRYREPAIRYARRYAAYQIVSELPRFILEGLAFGGMLGVILVLLVNQSASFADAVPMLAIYAFAGYRILPACQRVYQCTSTMRFSTFALNRIHEQLSDHSPTRLLSQLPTNSKVENTIQLQDVTFSYPNAVSPAVTNLSLEIKVNSTVGFVGTTGAGKTTLVDMLLGLVSPTQGSLLVDGDALSDIQSVRKWQSSIGYVPQDIYLTDESVAENIAFARSTNQIDLERVHRAARLAGIHDFVVSELPQGYDTTVGERGVRLSGGQKQRIGIARALYKDPPVLFFDEATSSLDNVTENAVMDSIRNLTHSKTIIMVAHRLSTVRLCDQIYVLEQGNIVAQGTYNELCESSSHFQRMVAGE